VTTLRRVSPPAGDAVSLADLVRMAGGGVPAPVALVMVRALAEQLVALDRETPKRSRLAISPERVRVHRDRRIDIADPAALSAVDQAAVPGEARPFAAPELLKRTPCDDRAEVFALGALLH